MGKTSQARDHNSAGQSFFWQGLLILLPLAILATTGIWSLRGQRQAVEQKARQDASATAEQMAKRISREIHEQLSNAHPPVPLVEEDEPFPFLYPVNPEPPDDLGPDQRFQVAIGNPSELEALLADSPDAKSAAGLPLKVLILYQMWLSASDEDSFEATQELVEAAISTHPSIFTEPILQQVVSKAKSAWEFHNEIRQILREHLPSLRRIPRSQWVQDDADTHWRLEILDDPA